MVVKLQFGGESPMTIRAQCAAIRDFPDPLDSAGMYPLANAGLAAGL